jgi:prepilin-type N-terminal cleavage/methylation domain-containing protein
MGNRGGGGEVHKEELKADSEKCLLSQYFSKRFLQLICSLPFGFTLVELLMVIAIIGVSRTPKNNFIVPFGNFKLSKNH